MTDLYISYPLNQKKRVLEIIKNPYDIKNNTDRDIFNKLKNSDNIIHNSFSEYRELLRLKNRDFYQNDISELTILPTLKCNFNCSYCFEQSKDKDMENDILGKVAKELYINSQINKLLIIRWFGGEPLLKLNHIETVNKFANELQDKNGNNFASMVTTNGYLLTDENQNRLMDAHITTIDITFDGSPVIHNSHRFSQDDNKTYNTISENVKNFLDKDPINNAIIRFQLHSTDSVEIDAVIKEIYSFDKYKSQINFYFRFIFTNCLDSWSDGETQKVKNSDQIKILEYMYKKIMHKGFSPVIYGKSFSYCSYENENKWVISPNGDCFKCTVGATADRIHGTLTDNGIEDNKLKRNGFNTKVDPEHTKECTECGNLPLCWGGCQLVRYQSSLDNEKPFICKFNKKPISEDNIPSVLFLDKLTSMKQIYKNIQKGIV